MREGPCSEEHLEKRVLKGCDVHCSHGLREDPTAGDKVVQIGKSA